ncbi:MULTISPECIES: hypothetical protein [unclassified Rathayibacter]|uniref:hypothetical protein n=1 Tax=unclassified Rathayibacter TaxID=2609250 RepID=UPI00104D765C|nr:MULTISPECIES: hypothetical protein [unclassified Rathayibacter]
MTENILVAIIAAAGVILAGVIQAPRLLRNTRADILRDIEIYNALPDTLTARKVLLERIGKDVTTLATGGEKRRDATSVVLGIVFLGVSWWLTVQLLNAQEWWWWIASPALLLGWSLGAFGFVQGLQRHHRTSTGSVIKGDAVSAVAPAVDPSAGGSEEEGGGDRSLAAKETAG